MERLTGLSIHLSMIREHSASGAKIAHGVADFETYIKNNSEFIPNFGDRYKKSGPLPISRFSEQVALRVVRLCTQAREVGAHRMDLNFVVTSSTSVSHLMQRQ
jgi:hypothetical protein